MRNLYIDGLMLNVEYVTRCMVNRETQAHVDVNDEHYRLYGGCYDALDDCKHFIYDALVKDA